MGPRDSLTSHVGPVPGPISREAGVARVPIRFGVLCAGTTLQAWQAQCVAQLLKLDDVRLALVIVDHGNAHSPALSERIRSIHVNRLLFQLYRNRFFRPRARRPVDLRATLSKAPVIHCTLAKKGRFSRYFSKEAVQAIRGYDLDFILLFSRGIFRGDILNAARYGVWSYHHDDEEKYRGGPPCFWEIYHGDPVTGAILQRLTDRLDGGIVLRKGFVRTVAHSYAGNVDAAYFKSAPWPAQVCVDIRNGRAGYLSAPPSKTRAPIFYAPTNRQMMVFALKLLRNRLARRRGGAGR
jgi:hypothetical protein